MPIASVNIPIRSTQRSNAGPTHSKRNDKVFAFEILLNLEWKIWTVQGSTFRTDSIFPVPTLSIG